MDGLEYQFIKDRRRLVSHFGARNEIHTKFSDSKRFLKPIITFFTVSS